ncbi:MAG TPA: four-carbon acid sugar kinase family protein [Verrucomicrobiae bacterium]|nr:four-carbon acid sugar kinase family protein [Verrucomicrobiae bacterium]
MIGVIADDLTGAAEIGAIGLRYGMRSQILTNGKGGGDADLICVDTDSRACDPDDAAKRVAAAANLLRKAGAEWIYKKVDSVLRGHAIVETEAAMGQLKFTRAILAPANPSLGRTIRGGRYFVKGRLIHKTEFARDPEHPRTSPDVLDLLDKSRVFPITICDVDGALPETGSALAAAASSADVTRWAKRIELKTTFAAGGAEFFNQLLAVAGHKEQVNGIEEMSFDDGSRELFICGTLSDSGRQFLRAARGLRTPVFSLPIELLWGAEFTGPAVDAIVRRIVTTFQTHRRIILYGGSTVARERIVSRRLVEFLARLAASVLKEVDVKRIHVEGGATSAQLVRQMGWPRMTVSRELAPGVVMLAVDAAHERFLIIKPGSYVWPEMVFRRSQSEDPQPDDEVSVS